MKQCCCIYFYLVSIACLAQTGRIDSLRMQLATSEDTSAVASWVKLSQAFFSYSLEESLAAADSALALATDINYFSGIARSEYFRGYALLELGSLEKALQAGVRALNYFADAGDSIMMASSYNLVGLCHLRLGQTEDALDALFKAAKISENIKRNALAASSYNNLGEIYNYAGDRVNARKYYQKALNNSELARDTSDKAMILMNLGNMQDSTAMKIRFLEESIAIGESHGYHRNLAYSYPSMGDVYFAGGIAYKEAIEYYSKGLVSAREVQDRRMITYNLLYLGASWLQLDDLDSSAYYIMQISGEDLEENSLRNYLYYLAKFKNASDDPASAFHLLDSVLTMHIEYFNRELADQTAEANTRYETEKRDAEIVRQNLLIQKQQTNRNYILLGAGLLMAVLVILVQLSLNRMKLKRRKAEADLFLEKQRAEDLEEIAKTKTELFNNISHELRTPLTMIIGPLEEAEKKIKNIPIRKDVQLALQNSRRLTKLINEILELSKLEAGKLTIKMTDIRLYSFLQRIYSAFSSLADSQQILLHSNLASFENRGFIIESDAEKLEKILNNLLINAIKFTMSGSNVHLDLNAEQLAQGILEISITDEGVGIPEDEIALIFDRHYQGKIASPLGGSGIGLTLTKELVELMHGSISLESSVGVGSVFTISIPTVVHAAEIKQPLRPENSDSETLAPTINLDGNRSEILIVEDDLYMSRYLQNLLRPTYNCTLAYNGIQALEYVSKKKYDLITSDVMMPEMDGFEFRKELNRRPDLRDTPFIMLTARALEEDKLNGLKLGIDDYVTKPFSAAELQARILNLLRNKRVRNSLATEVTDEQSKTLTEKAKVVVIKQLDSPNFKVTDLAHALNYSPRQLSRVLKKETGFSSVEFILEVRLQRAYNLIQSQSLQTIAEVQFAVGIESASYFTTKFRQRFGVNPSHLYQLI